MIIFLVSLLFNCKDKMKKESNSTKTEEMLKILKRKEEDRFFKKELEVIDFSDKLELFQKYLGKAINEGYTDSVYFLLNKEIDINFKDSSGDTPLIIAARAGYLDIFKMLAEKTNNLEATDEYGNTPLIEAALKGSVGILEYLLDKGVNINSQNKDKNTALMKAAIHNNESAIDLLIRLKADINLSNVYDKNALMMAAEYENLNIFKKLLAAGADIYKIDKSGSDILTFVAANNSIDILEFLINNNYIDRFNSKNNSLFIAAAIGHIEVVDLLLNQGINVNYIDINSGNTALIAATKEGHYEIVRRLIETGADFNFKNVNNSNALIFALYSNERSKLINILLEAGIDTNIISNEYSNPLKIAIEHGYNDEIIKLIKAGADLNLIIETKVLFDILNSNDTSNNVIKDLQFDENNQIKGIWSVLLSIDNFRKEDNINAFAIKESIPDNILDNTSNILDDNNQKFIFKAARAGYIYILEEIFGTKDLKLNKNNKVDDAKDALKEYIINIINMKSNDDEQIIRYLFKFLDDLYSDYNYFLTESDSDINKIAKTIIEIKIAVTERLLNKIISIAGYENITLEDEGAKENVADEIYEEMKNKYDSKTDKEKDDLKKRIYTMNLLEALIKDCNNTETVKLVLNHIDLLNLEEEGYLNQSLSRLIDRLWIGNKDELKLLLNIK